MTIYLVRQDSSFSVSMLLINLSSLTNLKGVRMSSPSGRMFNSYMKTTLNMIDIVYLTILIGDCRNLQDLNISNCKYINDDVIKIITTGCPTLLYVNMSRNEVSDASIRYLSRYWIKIYVFFVLVAMLVVIKREKSSQNWLLKFAALLSRHWVYTRETRKAPELRH